MSFARSPAHPFSTIRTCYIRAHLVVCCAGHQLHGWCARLILYANAYVAVAVSRRGPSLACSLAPLQLYSTTSLSFTVTRATCAAVLLQLYTVFLGRAFRCAVARARALGSALRDRGSHAECTGVACTVCMCRLHSPLRSNLCVCTDCWEYEAVTAYFCIQSLLSDSASILSHTDIGIPDRAHAPRATAIAPQGAHSAARTPPRESGRMYSATRAARAPHSRTHLLCHAPTSTYCRATSQQLAWQPRAPSASVTRPCCGAGPGSQRSSSARGPDQSAT